MSICPVCNGYEVKEIICSSCTQQMEDQGKVSDYFDDYSPYMDIDLMKLEDGYPVNYSLSQCVHLYKCPHCGKEDTQIIQE